MIGTRGTRGRGQENNDREYLDMDMKESVTRTRKTWNPRNSGYGQSSGSGWGGSRMISYQGGQSGMRNSGGHYKPGGLYPVSGYSGPGRPQERIFTSFLGPRSVLNINKGTGPIGNGYVHPLSGPAQSFYQVRPGVFTPGKQGSFLDLINTSYEPFILLLAAGGAVLSFLLYQVSIIIIIITFISISIIGHR